jgi:hypothetical protein
MLFRQCSPEAHHTLQRHTHTHTHTHYIHKSPLPTQSEADFTVMFSFLLFLLLPLIVIMLLLSNGCGEGNIQKKLRLNFTDIRASIHFAFSVPPTYTNILFTFPMEIENFSCSLQVVTFLRREEGIFMRIRFSPFSVSVSTFVASVLREEQKEEHFRKHDDSHQDLYEQFCTRVIHNVACCL